MTKNIGLAKSANYSVDESNGEVGHSKDDKNCWHYKISEVKAHFYLFWSLAIEVVILKKVDYNM